MHSCWIPGFYLIKRFSVYSKNSVYSRTVFLLIQFIEIPVSYSKPDYFLEGNFCSRQYGNYYSDRLEHYVYGHRQTTTDSFVFRAVAAIKILVSKDSSISRIKITMLKNNMPT